MRRARAEKDDGRRLSATEVRAAAHEIRALPTGATLPNWSDLSLGSRFAVLLQLVPADDVVATFGMPMKKLNRYRSEIRPTPDLLARLAAKTEMPLDWIISGRPMERRPPVIYIDPSERSATDNDIPIRKLAFRVSAGTGSPVIDDSASFTRFPRSILERGGVRMESARLMEAHGDSMRETINDGDLMLVDVGDNETIAEGKVYVFSIGDEIFVKRLRRVGGRVLMRADNQTLFPGEEAIPDGIPFRVYGRVKWSGRNL